MLTKKFLCGFIPLMLQTLSTLSIYRWNLCILTEDDIEIIPYKSKQGSGYVIKVTIPVTTVCIGQDANITKVTDILYGIAEELEDNYIFALKTRLV